MTIVEYSLLVALLVVPTIAALDLLRDSTAAKVDQTAEDMSDPTIPPRPTTTAPTSPTTTSTPPTTTTTTPPTTTTAPPPTTTTPPPTTTAPATQSRTQWAQGTRRTASNDRWAAGSTLTITDDYGRPVNGATVVIRVQYKTGSASSGQWTNVSPTSSATTNASGALTIDSGLFYRSGSNPPRADNIRFVVVSVTASGLTWNGADSQVTVGKP